MNVQAMEYAQLGVSNLSVSRLGFGGWAIGGHGFGAVLDSESIRAIHRAIDIGVTLFDTADVYGLGHSEEILARALPKGDDRIILATKGGVRRDSGGKIVHDISREALRTAIDGSLRRLGVDCIPLYQLHWPDGRTPIGDAVETLLLARQAGKINQIGCCNCSWEMIREAQTVAPIASVQVPFNLLDRWAVAPVIERCREAQISVLAFSPLAQGVLSGKYGPQSRFDAHDVRSRNPFLAPDRIDRTVSICGDLKRIGARYGRTSSQVAIRWVLQKPGVTCALAGAKTARQVEENASIDWRLTSDDLFELEKCTA